MKLDKQMRIAAQTKGELKKLKAVGDSYDTVIKRLLEAARISIKWEFPEEIDKALEDIEEAEE